MKFFLIIVAGFLGAYALGAFAAIVIAGVPPDWLLPLSGRPPAIIPLLALGPIIFTGIVVLLVRLFRKKKSRVLGAKRKNGRQRYGGGL